MRKEKEDTQKTSVCSSCDRQNLVEHFHSEVDHHPEEDHHTEDDWADGRREDIVHVAVVHHTAFGSREDNPDSPVQSSPEGWYNHHITVVEAGKGPDRERTHSHLGQTADLEDSHSPRLLPYEEGTDSVQGATLGMAA